MDVAAHSDGAATTQHGFSPYQDNGGTVVAVAHGDYAVLAADTRLSVGYRIHSRNATKCYRLTDKCVIGSAGMNADIITLHKVLKIRIQQYQFDHNRMPSITAIAQMLSTVLYGRRFFPYYTFNLLAGIDESGKGGIFTYDAVGNFERTTYSASGSGSALVTSVLDSQIGHKNQPADKQSGPVSKTEVIDVVKDVLQSATERDIYTGDTAEVFVIDASGIHLSTVSMRKD
eukprot:GHVH01010688.1.p1 GENE.GHVH01010688.1~~GHVH01010688.1.p1  ORF type:complete len:254 (+),score=26.44 GHVH01010688.1:73-762(+)